MIGGNGNDTYYVDNVHDVVTELAGQGSDSVFSTISYTMTDNVENLTLTGVAAINGVGNAGDNLITGNDAVNNLQGGDGNDTLIGGGGNDILNGGLGNDTLKGGLGDDSYNVDSTSDVIVELAGEGSDSVNSTITWSLGANLESLYLKGTANIDGTGNSQDNLLMGNSGDNHLYGGSGADTLLGGDGNDWLDGGTGTDTMWGGTGNDSYVVTSTSDVINELANQGHDIVYSSVTWTLGANLEDLDFSGAGNVNGTGNGLDNWITGNVGNNTLSGQAGNDFIDGFWGNDTYIGGTGADTFNFSQGTGHDVDTISDFSLSDGDIIRVHDAVSPGNNVVITQVGADVKIDLGDGDVIMVLHTTDNAAFESHIAYI